MLRRHPPARGVWRVASNRVYVLPTREGVLFALVAAVLLLGSINYAVSLGFALTFLLVGLGLASAVHAHRNLVGLSFTLLDAEPVFAGQTARFPLLVGEADKTRRPGLVFKASDAPAREAGVSGLFLERPAPARGVAPLGRVVVETRYPLGLFRAWSLLHSGAEGVTYPAPGKRLPLPEPVDAGKEGGARRRAGPDGDEFSGLRPYVPGDSPRRISWKSLSRGGEVLTKTFDEAAGDLLFDFDALPEFDDEARLGILARWILDAERLRAPYRIKLPGAPPLPGGLGPQHQRLCLEALARWTP